MWIKCQDNTIINSNVLRDIKYSTEECATTVKEDCVIGAKKYFFNRVIKKGDKYVSIEAVRECVKEDCTYEIGICILNYENKTELAEMVLDTVYKNLWEGLKHDKSVDVNELINYCETKYKK